MSLVKWNRNSVLPSFPALFDDFLAANFLIGEAEITLLQTLPFLQLMLEKQMTHLKWKWLRLEWIRKILKLRLRVIY